MAFCMNCGTQLPDGAKFCPGCGKAVSLPQNEASGKRKSVYEGELHKCPNCGELLDSFVTICPACGYEIRDAESASSVRELTLKLEKISAQRMPSKPDNGNSLVKMIYGFSPEPVAARKAFEKQKNEEMASLIINFPVPNTREDILEFMILTASNIDVKHLVKDAVTKAWIKKLNQLYHKAELSMAGQPEFVQIKEIYDLKKKELKNREIITAIIIISSILLFLIIAGYVYTSNSPDLIVLFTALLIIIACFAMLIIGAKNGYWSG